MFGMMIATMQDTPSISIIMSIFKESVQAVDAIVQDMLAQTLDDFEFVIVLDWPENQSVRTYLEELTVQDGRVKVLFNEKNIKLGASLNRAVQFASGKYLARADVSDRCPFPERLQKQYTYLEANPDIDLLFTWWHEEDEQGHVVARKPRHVDALQANKYFFVKSLFLHPTLMVRAEVLKKHPYPAMDRPEDLILFLELLRKGYQFGILEEVLYLYAVDRCELAVRYQKIRTYSGNLLEALGRELRYYWRNVYFWLYGLRVFGEYVMTRNFFVFQITHKYLATAWKKVFRSV